MRIGTVFELMIDGPNSQFALQRSEYAFDLRQLHIAGPQHRRVFAGEIAAQQIVSIALLGSLELRLIGAKRECRARDFLVFFRKPHLYEAESPPLPLPPPHRCAAATDRARADCSAWRAVYAEDEPAVCAGSHSLWPAVRCFSPKRRVRLHARTASPRLSRAP